MDTLLNAVSAGERVRIIQVLLYKYHRLFMILADSLFLATVSEFIIPIENYDTIIWDSAPINPGGFFSTERGAYRAPAHGYYL